MILIVGGIKGGCGKTTLATNIAVYLLRQKRNVLLIDADDQRSCCDWASQRAVQGLQTIPTVSITGKGAYSQIESFKSTYDEIIVDTGGRDTSTQRSVLTAADLFLVPLKPRSFDLWTLGILENMYIEVRHVNPDLKSLCVINQADSSGSDNTEAVPIIEESGIFKCSKHTIGNRKCFANASSQGMGIIEMKGRNVLAEQELYGLLSDIYV
jgi:chromosome partitioning protein